MKKLIAISGITAAIIFTGCWDSGSSSSAPDFAKKQAQITTTSDATKVLATLNEDGDIGIMIANKLVKFKNLKNAQKTFLPKEAVEFMKKTDNTAKGSNCSYYKTIDEEECPNGGSVTMTAEIKPEGNICKITEKLEFKKCKSGDENNEGYLNGILERETDEYIANDGLYAFLFKEVNHLTQIKKVIDNNITHKYSLNINVVNLEKDGYKVDNNNSFTYTNEFNVKSVGKGSIEIYADNNLTKEVKGNINVAMNFKDIEDREIATINGWINLQQKNLLNDGSYSIKQYGKAYKNFVVDINDTGNEILSILNGSIGSTCTNGMVNIETNKTIIDNYTDDYKMPNAGKLIISGKGKATVEFRLNEEENVTEMVISVEGDGNKTYNNWDDVLRDANASKCLDETINLPFFWW